MSARDDVVECIGVVTETLPGAMFRVEVKEGLPIESHTVLATLSGRMKKNKVRIILGDVVRMELSLYDLEKGRIVFREKIMPKKDSEEKSE